MAWVESHQTLASHPKTRRLARKLAISVPQAIGHLHLLWWWCLDYAQDGELSRFEPADIADGAMWDGDPALFVRAILEAGFVDGEAGGLLTVHDWGEYAGRLIERRSADAARKRAARQPHVHETSAGRPADGGQTADVTVPYHTIPIESISTLERDRAREAPEPIAPGTMIRPGKNAPRPIPAKPLPKPFPLSEEMRVWAQMEAPSVRDLDRQHKLFCAHYWAEGDAEKRSDWRPMWESWMLRAMVEFAPRGSPGRNGGEAALRPDRVYVGED